MKDVLVPNCYEVLSITHDTADVFTLVLDKQDSSLPGQFNMLYQFGFGECAISISGNPKENKTVHTIRAVGSVTRSLQKLQPGDEIGVRGPFGTYWPLEKKGSDLLVIAGGIGFAALRSALFTLAANAKDYQKITLLYGTRKVEDILFKKEMEEWRRLGIDIEVTLDFADPRWKGRVGVVTHLIQHHMPHPENTLVLMCGPEIMIHFALHELLGIGVNENNIYISMERNMQCAAGFCGHCQYGPYFLCKDGPVFCYSQIKNLLTVKEL
jgi:NAD(P)H-flavin reductase